MTGVPEEAISGIAVRLAWFVDFAFTSGHTRVWNGYRNIHLSGQDWLPLGPENAVVQIEDMVGDSVPAVTLKLAGVTSDQIQLAVSESDEVRGQLCFIYNQAFDQNWQPWGDFAPYTVLRMDNLKISRSIQGDGSFIRQIEITGESALTTGANPPAGRYSSLDQAMRHPSTTDKYFDYMSANQQKRITWPNF